MSWKIVSGMLYHCLDCSETIQVDYEGGPTSTLIGEWGLIEQIILNGKYKKPVDFPYLHAEYICSKCYNNRVEQTRGIGFSQEEIVRLFQITDNVADIYDDFAEQVLTIIKELKEDWLRNLGLEYYAGLNQDIFNETLGHRHLKYKARRYKLIDAFIEKAQELIRADYKNMINNSPKIQDILANYQEYVKPLLNEAKVLMKKVNPDVESLTVFEEKEIFVPLNLNCHIIHESTIRVPRKETDHITVYSPHEVLVSDIETTIEKADFRELDLVWCSNQNEDELMIQLKQGLTGLIDFMFKEA